MSDAKRRKIRQLRALAASTTFPAEAASARAKADKLEAELRSDRPEGVSFGRNRTPLYGFDPSAAIFHAMHEEMIQAMRAAVKRAVEEEAFQRSKRRAG